MDDEQVERRTDTATRRLVLNPTSGRAGHVERAHRLASEHRFPVVETDHRGHATELARRAVADGVELLAVCGGDGTLHEVVVGIYEADALDAVRLALVPAGTENFVARELGVTSMEEGFEVATGETTRRIDLGLAGDEPFVMSAIAGLPADVSAAATHDRKRQFGRLAFLAGAVEEGLDFGGIQVAVDVHPAERDRVRGRTGRVSGPNGGWSVPEGLSRVRAGDGSGRAGIASGRAGEPSGNDVQSTGEVLAILLGNVRTFATEDGPGTLDDGRFEVTIVERTSTLEALVEAAEHRLLDEEPPHVTTFRGTGFDVTGLDGEDITYSIDGEIRSFETVAFEVLPAALEVMVAPPLG